jgi:hypothetical protein
MYVMCTLLTISVILHILTMVVLSAHLLYCPVLASAHLMSAQSVEKHSGYAVSIHYAY